MPSIPFLRVDAAGCLQRHRAGQRRRSCRAVDAVGPQFILRRCRPLHTAVDTAVQVFSVWSSVGVVPILPLRSHSGVRRTVAWDAADFTDVWRAPKLQPWPTTVHLVHGMFCRHLLNARSTIPAVCRWYSVLWPLPSHHRVQSMYYADPSVFLH